MGRPSFFDTLPLPCFVTGKRGGLVRVNQAFESLFGRPANLTDLAADNLSDLLRGLAAADGDFEADWLAADGRKIGGRVALWPLGRNVAGAFIPRDRGQDVKALLDALPLALLVLDEDHRVSHWNAGLERLTGLSRREMVGRADHWRAFYRRERPTLADLALSGDVESILERYSGRGVRPSPLSPDAFEAEAEYKGRDGKKRNLLFTAAPIRGGGGETVGAVEMLYDISYRKQLEAQVRSSEANYRRLVEGLNEGVAIFTPEGHLFANQHYLELFGYDRVEDLARIGFIGLLDPGAQRDFLAWSRSAALHPFEGAAVRADGSVFQAEVTLAPITYTGQAAFQVTVRDISPHKQIQDELIQAERLEATGTLAFELAHEINNPLGGIITYARLLASELDKDSEAGQTMAKIIKLANRCKIIVGGLLDFARQDSQAKQLVDINEVINDTLDIVEGHLLLRRVKVSKTLALGLPLFLANRVKLEQVFLNLIVNAMEAMGGEGVLSIFTDLDDKKNEIFIKIKDSGPGIDPADLARIFEPFYTKKNRCRGTGLGLAISHGIISRHGGRIEVASRPGEGATFTVHLPLPGRS